MESLSLPRGCFLCLCSLPTSAGFPAGTGVIQSPGNPAVLQLLRDLRNPSPKPQPAASQRGVSPSQRLWAQREGDTEEGHLGAPGLEGMAQAQGTSGKPLGAADGDLEARSQTAWPRFGWLWVDCDIHWSCPCDRSRYLTWLVCFSACGLQTSPAL